MNFDALSQQQIAFNRILKIYILLSYSNATS